MERIVIGRTGLEVYRLGFGGIPLQRASETQAVETVLHAIHLGVDFIDTSRAYTTSERRIGLALKQTDKKVTLASKSHNKTAEGARADLEISLKEFQRDYIDLYQCHFVKDEADYQKVISPGGALESLKKAKEEGLIGNIGITSHSLDVLDRSLDDGLFDTIMVCFSFLEPLAREKIIPKALGKNVGVIAMKPFSGGVIENARLALKYALSHSGILVIAGVEHKDLFEENWKVFQDGQPLTEEEKRRLKKYASAMKRSFAGGAITVNLVQKRFPFRRYWASAPWSNGWGKGFCRKAGIGKPSIKPETAPLVRCVRIVVPINFPYQT